MERHFIEIPLILEEEGQKPCYQSEEAAGADLLAYIEEDIFLDPGSSCLVPTGVRMAIPKGYEAQVRPRSGLALKHQITVLNTPGTIDSDYRGEIGVILINRGKTVFRITKKMRIAQIVFVPIVQASFIIQNSLEESVRGASGFGATGIYG